jgi:uncharacterized protein YqeY
METSREITRQANTRLPFFIFMGTAPMNIRDRINNDLKQAMKSGDKLRLETLRTIRAQFIELEKRGLDRDITPDDELAALNTAMKRRKEAIEMYQKAGRIELVKQEEAELGIIASYLPRQLSREEAMEVVAAMIRESGAASAKDFGKVMPLAMKELKGKIDGKIVQELVRERLGS